MHALLGNKYYESTLRDSFDVAKVAATDAIGKLHNVKGAYNAETNKYKSTERSLNIKVEGQVVLVDTINIGYDIETLRDNDAMRLSKSRTHPKEEPPT